MSSTATTVFHFIISALEDSLSIPSDYYKDNICFVISAVYYYCKVVCVLLHADLIGFNTSLTVARFEV